MLGMVQSLTSGVVVQSLTSGVVLSICYTMACSVLSIRNLTMFISEGEVVHRKGGV